MNPNTVHYLNIFLGLGAIILQIISVIAIFLLFFGSKKNYFFIYLEKHYLSIGFLISFFASLFSLVYSEIIQFAPCHLCWYQRIFMFPLVLLFAVALWNKDKKVIKYVLPLLCAGFIISVYQNFGYYFGEGNAPCDASGVSCYQRLVSVFGGYISIPMLSLTAFFSLLVLTLVFHFSKKAKEL
jgi:disulfide bond formation protein DsbB